MQEIVDRFGARTATPRSLARCCCRTSTTRPRCTRASYATRDDIDAAMRFGCGYPIGPLALIDALGAQTRRDRTREALRRDRRPAAPAGSILSRWPRQLDLRAAVGDADVASRSCVTTSRRSASSAPARWRPASSRSSPRPAMTSCTSAAATTRSTASSPRITKSLDKAIASGKLDEDGKAAVLGRLTGATSGRRWPTPTSSSRRSPRTSTSSSSCSRDLDRIAKPGAILATTTSSLSITASPRPPAGRRTSSACTSSTRHRS